jgi:type I restriction enzyme S subunit
MSRLDELIDELCPNGVEYVKLASICDIKRGERVTKSQLIEDGIYPVFSGGVSPMGYFNKFNREENTITVAQYGTAGYVNWIDEKFWANDVCYSLFPKEIINKRYLYFVLVNLQDFIYTLRIDAVPAHLPVDRLGNIKIPLPPLPVQQEIVRILDNFTELTAELQAELQARKKQYEYYRDTMLACDKEIPMVKLKDIA